jgi:hypothetical protein
MPRALIISPQSWEGFQVSKHHYARTLAAAGWEVIFADPPRPLGQADAVQITNTDVPGLRNLRYQTWFPYRIKFRARWLFDWAMARQARRILQATGPLDLVWDFDNAYQFRSLKAFGARKSLFHLVDEPTPHGLGDKDADHFLYLDESYCSQAGHRPQSDHQISHGLSLPHAIEARKAAAQASPAPRRDRPVVGFVGNLAAGWIDWPAFTTMVQTHSEADFMFWGPLPVPDHAAFQALQAQPNTQFLGLTPPTEIARAGATVDIWTLPYDRALLGVNPISSHKILEYLASGKVVVMDHQAGHVSNPHVVMTQSSGDGSLPMLLDQTLAQLDVVNAPDRIAARRAYALDCTYDKRLAYITDLVKLPTPTPTPIQQEALHAV